MPSSWAELVAGLSASTLTLAALVLTLIALAHLSLRWWIRRKARQDDARGLRKILPPLALLIWIHGLYFAISLLVRQTGPQTLVDPIIGAVT